MIKLLPAIYPPLPIQQNPNRLRGRKLQALRSRLFVQYQGRCPGCGCVLHQWQLDHIISLQDGGSDDPANLQPLCLQCHNLKTNARRNSQPGQPSSGGGPAK